MQRFPEIAAGLALMTLLLATPAFSGAGTKDAKIESAGIEGIWCTLDESEILYIETKSIGFNEHTMCELSEPIPSGSGSQTTRFQTDLSCANIYIHGDEIIRAFEIDMGFSAQLSANGLLDVTLLKEGEAPQSLRYQRCDN